MKEKNLVDEVMKSATVFGFATQFKRYIKWIVIAGVTFTGLSMVLLVIIIIGLVNVVISPLVSNAPSITQQGQSVVNQGQSWLEAQFNQEQTQLEDIQKQLDDLKQTMEQHTTQENVPESN